ncbi:MAG TPA: GlsB/YeaQ/YmgE family stress response membrane protein [Deltaproteobacteria bacterium]|jgi:uncharacterized membrane protein YeaQ/YmgE (transglycosylase-associated protein family)|nr:GlsB/YeaQ/YmgE family stress response membrane protein [Deltaproteobacteria bacterium]
MHPLHILWAVLTGFVIGLLARAIMPGADPMGFLLTTALGIGGSLVGGFVGGLVSKPKEGAPFHPAGFLMSVVGAVILLFLWRHVL